ncbi:MAG: FKBP-type peptidyl-prolyl cis-trans isomerase [Actinomycetia bacterium]|nr:FKBP-type peptidyl-prolyl cis-trans isomerase [Actinomycetes bacterium]
MMRKFSRICKLSLSLLLLFSLSLLAVGCNKQADDPMNGTVPSDAVAATLRGTNIMEADITATVNVMRKDANGNTADDVTWTVMLKCNDYTPDSLRQAIIKNQFMMPIVVLSEAGNAGITPDAKVIDDQITKQKEQAQQAKQAQAATQAPQQPSTGDPWVDYLRSMGYANEDAYRRLLEAQNVATPLLQQKIPTTDPTKNEINSFLEENAPYMVGKRSSTIIIPINDKTTAAAAKTAAQTALNRINKGEKFATVADAVNKANGTLTAASSTNSTASTTTDTASASTSASGYSGLTAGKGGDVGWEALVSLPTEYSTALGKLKKGQVSTAPVVTDSAVYVIICTDNYELPASKKVDTKAIPQSLQDAVMPLLQDELNQQRQNDYFNSLTKDGEAEMVINPIPDGLPYNVDMNLAPTLQQTDTSVGTGAEAKKGDKVTVSYVGKLADGTVFDASDQHGGKLDFTIGSGDMIAGFDQGVVGMKVGGVRTLVIPADLAYGAGGSSNGAVAIPPYAALTFDIKLMAIGGKTTGSDGVGLSSGLGTADSAAADASANTNPPSEADEGKTAQ